jgi:hypothetical protein
VTKLDIAPSEFWQMRPRHFWWLIEAATKTETKRGMSEAEARDLLEWMENGDSRSKGKDRR